MAWDSNRPVPWARLFREWVIYAGLMAVVFVLLFRDSGLAGVFIGLVMSLPLYLALGWVLAKLGYSRTRLGSVRGRARGAGDEPATSTSAGSSPGSSASGPARARPAPTRRTSTGPTQRPRPKSRRR